MGIMFGNNLILLRYYLSIACINSEHIRKNVIFACL